MVDVEFSIEGPIARIELNRPDKRNAFHPQMINSITEAFAQVNKDADVRLVILSGNGQSFCAGADLDWMKSMSRYSFQENVEDSEALFEMFDTARKCSRVVLGRVHGHVMGGALGLLAVCDIAIAHKETVFCFSEPRLGLAPSVISPFILDKCSPASITEYMLTAKKFDSQRAYELGLVQYQGTGDELKAYEDEIIERMKGLGPLAVCETKAIIRFVRENNWDAIRSETTHLISRLRIGEEGQEGMRAFFDKTKANWNLT